MLESPERRRLSDMVASRIHAYIVQHNLQPGDRLPTEMELAQQFGVSRVSIREATKALGFLGFLEATPRRGTTVGKVDFRRITQFLELHPALRNASWQQLIETRQVLELGLLPHVCERMRNDEGVYDELDLFLIHFEQNLELSAWLELDREFHLLMLNASGLAPLFLFRELLNCYFRRLQRLVEQPEIRDKLYALLPNKQAEHQQIIDLLRDQKPELAQAELKAHISSWRPILELDLDR